MTYLRSNRFSGSNDYKIIYIYLVVATFCTCAAYISKRKGGAGVAEWLSSWLAEQEDRGSIPGLATWIFRDWLSPASKSKYGWKITKSTLIFKAKQKKKWKGPGIKFCNLIEIFWKFCNYYIVLLNNVNTDLNKRNISRLGLHEELKWR